MTNAASETQVKESKQKDKNRRREQLDDIKAVMSTPQGRRFVWRLMGKFGLSRQPSVGDSRTEFNCGVLNAALFIQGETIEASQDLYVLMMQESRKDKEKENNNE